MAQRRKWGGVATLWGMLFGALAIVLVALDRPIFSAARASVRQGRALAMGGPLLRVALLALAFILFFLAGIVAARSTRHLEAGIVAGLLAGSVAGVAQLVLALLAVGGATRRGAAVPVARAVEAVALGRSVAILVVAALVGAGLGALGGLVGRGRQPAPGAPYLQAPPQGAGGSPAGYMPPPNYAPYPGQAVPAEHAAPHMPAYGPQPDAPTLTPPVLPSV